MPRLAHTTDRCLSSYAFRTTDKAALQEIGPRFTLKLRWMKKSIPAVQNFGDPAKPLEFAPNDDEDVEEHDAHSVEALDGQDETEDTKKTIAPVTPGTEDEYIWMWKVSLFLQLS